MFLFHTFCLKTSTQEIHIMCTIFVFVAKLNMQGNESVAFNDLKLVLVAFCKFVTVHHITEVSRT